MAKVQLPCRSELGLGSWLSSNQLKMENMVFSFSESQPNPKQSHACGLEVEGPRQLYCFEVLL